MSKINVNTWEPESGTDLTLGASGDTVTIPSGATINCRRPSNALINGDMRVAQRGTSFTASDNNDDVYTLDRWLLLSDGNDIVDVTQQSSGGTSGESQYIRLDVETTAKKFGICQIIETKNCRDLIGQSASISFDAKVTNASKLSDIRAVVLAWNHTADTVTSDVVSAWGAEGSNPTFATNWTAENTAANLSVTTSWVNYKIENISIDTSSANNVAILIWQNNVATNDTAGIFLEVSEVKLEAASTASPFEYNTYTQELHDCERYYQTYASGFFGYVITTSIIDAGFSFRQRMRASPSVTLLDDSPTFNEQNTANRTGSSSSITTSANYPDGTGMVRIDGFGGAATLNKVAIGYNGSTDMLGFDAEL